MLKAVGLFARKKTTRQFKDFYAEWFNTLKNALLPSLRIAMSESDSSLTRLSTQMEALHRHFQSYYDALDLAAQNDVAQLLCPTWRNPLEKPFVFLGDFHPYLFTNLLRSFLTQNDTDSDDENDADSMFRSVRQRERRQGPLRRPLVDRDGVEEPVVQFDGEGQAGVAWAAADAAGGGGVCELRKGVLVETMGATSIYQGALFLEGLAQFLVGFRDPELLAQFELCKTPLSKQSALAI